MLAQENQPQAIYTKAGSNPANQIGANTGSGGIGVQTDLRKKEHKIFKKQLLSINELISLPRHFQLSQNY